MITWKKAVIGLGANLGDREGNLREALEKLSQIREIRNLAASSSFETEPIGLKDQPRFINRAAVFETTLTPDALLEVLQSLESAAGRNRAQEIRWGPRTLDLDLLLFEGEERTGPGLQIPHPRMWDRPFVLEPLRELASKTSLLDPWKARIVSI